MSEPLPDCMMPDGGDPCRGFTAVYDELAATATELTALRKRVTELEGALEPFGKLADRILDKGPVLGEYIIVEIRKITWNGEHDIKPSDLRRVRSALGGSQ